MFQRYAVKIVTPDECAMDDYHTALCSGDMHSNVFLWKTETDGSDHVVWEIHGVVEDERMQHTLNGELARNIGTLTHYEIRVR